MLKTQTIAVKESHSGLMQMLADRHDVIAEIIGPARVHYVDLPVYGNIGDLLIMLGTQCFFERHKVRPVIKAAYFNYRPEWARPGDVVVFQGGGNFGDLYKGPQQIRQRVVQELPQNRIVILPQTIHFRSKSAYVKCCETFSRHTDLHICVRDRQSYDLALPMTKNVYLLPDMAHQLWPIQAPRLRKGKRLGLLRVDDEAAEGSAADVDMKTDWPALVGRREVWFQKVHRIMRAMHLARIDRRFVSYELRLWVKYAEKLAGEAINLFAQYEEITTDRLHGHILACLMGMPNTFLDNSYGKNSGYAAAWTGASDIVRFGATSNQNGRAA